MFFTESSEIFSGEYGNYLAKTVKSIDVGIKTSDVIDKKKLLLSLNKFLPQM